MDEDHIAGQEFCGMERGHRTEDNFSTAWVMGGGAGKGMELDMSQKREPVGVLHPGVQVGELPLDLKINRMHPFTQRSIPRGAIFQ